MKQALRNVKQRIVYRLNPQNQTYKIQFNKKENFFRLWQPYFEGQFLSTKFQRTGKGNLWIISEVLQNKQIIVFNAPNTQILILSIVIQTH